MGREKGLVGPGESGTQRPVEEAFVKLEILVD
jgi:hypothetical protein